MTRHGRSTGDCGIGKATEDKYDEMCDVEAMIEEKIHDVIESPPKYNGNPEILFYWCKNLEPRLLNSKWETIQNKDVKRMLLSCITGTARREVVPFYQTGVAFERYETGVFLQKC